MTNNVTDPYLKVVHAIMEAVQVLTDIFPDSEQVTFNRANISTGAEYWFILTPGAFSDVRLEAHDDVLTWITECELAVSFAEYNERTEKFLLARGAIRQALKRPYALKNIKIKPPVLVTGGAMRQDVPGQNPNWLVQPLTVTVNQIVVNG